MYDSSTCGRGGWGGVHLNATFCYLNIHNPMHKGRGGGEINSSSYGLQN